MYKVGIPTLDSYVHTSYPHVWSKSQEQSYTTTIRYDTSTLDPIYLRFF